MNQEYILLAGCLWKILRKRIYLWRNHHTGGLLTNIAGILSRKVFYTSRRSYTAGFVNAVRMPVGIDTNTFKPAAGIERIPGSILSLGRIAPQKHLDILIKALGILHRKHIVFSADIYGDTLPADEVFRVRLKQSVREKGMANNVRFFPGVQNSETPAIYSTHTVFVNASAQGMYDKTMLEALACGCRVVSSSFDFGEDFGRDFSFKERDVYDLSETLERALSTARVDTHHQHIALEAHSLPILIKRITEEVYL